MNELLAGIAIAVVGSWWIEGRLASRTGRPGRGGRGLAVGLALLVGALALAPRLGLRYGESLVPRSVAAGLFLLLLAYVATLVPRLRRLLGRRLPARPDAVFFVLPAVVYLAIMPWATAQRPPDGDEPYNLLIAHSLAYDLDAELTNNYAERDSLRFVPRALEPQVRDPRGRNGEIYSRHNVLLPALLAPAYRLAGKHGALAVLCWIAAALPWMTLRLARRLFPDEPGPALLAYLVLALSSPLLIYSHQAWVEIPAALLLAVAVDRAWAMGAGRRDARVWVPLILALALLPLLKIRFLLVTVTVLAMLAWRLGRRGRRFVLLALACSAALAAAILVFNQIRYGNPLKYHHLQQMSFYWTRLDRYPLGLVGLFFDNAFGLFWTAPIWALALAPGRDKLRALRPLLWIIVPYLVMLVPRAEWYGGWSPPFRYGCVALPFFALLLIPPLGRRRGTGARLLLGALGSATALLTALWVARPGWTYNISHGRSHLVDFLTATQGVDAARFFPSATRPNPALWWWPPLVVLAVVLLWRWHRRAPARTAWLGAAVPWIALASLTLAMHRLPTRVVEAEDPYIRHLGGKISPDDWAVGRPRFRAGWRLWPRHGMVVPVVPGGRTCSIEVELRRFGARRPAVRVRAGEGEPQWARVAKTDEWDRLRLPDLEWPEGADSFELSIRLPIGADPKAGVFIDRILLSWSDREPAR